MPILPIMVGFVYFVCINIINIYICKLFLCVAEIGVNRSLPDPLSHYCVNCLYMKAIYGLNNVNSVLFCSDVYCIEGYETLNGN